MALSDTVTSAMTQLLLVLLFVAGRVHESTLNKICSKTQWKKSWNDINLEVLS